MARITLSFLLTALALAGNSAALSHHPNADVLGFDKRSPAPVPVPAPAVGRVGHAGRPSAAGAAPVKVKAKRHRRSAKGAKRSVEHHERKALEPVPEVKKRDLLTPSSSSSRVTLELKRAHGGFGEMGGVHPHIYLQQHINRGVRRHAKMTGRDLGADIDAQFEQAIRKRWISAYGHDADLVLRKRQRVGHSGSSSVKTGNEDDVAVNQAVETNDFHGGGGGGFGGFFGGNRGGNDGGVQQAGAGGQGQQAGNGQAGTAAGGADQGTGADAATGTGAGTGAATGAGSAVDNSDGFDQADLDALEQNTITKPNDPTASQSLGMFIESADVGYFAEVQVGTPPQAFKVLMDSGSSDFWVAGENCNSCGNAHKTLGVKESSTFVDTGKPFQVTYGTGAVQGTIVQDTVSIAGLQLANHTFGANTDETADFSAATVPFDSLMGLAISTLSNQKTLTPIESLAKQGTVGAAQMGFALGRVADLDNVGEITFGGIDQTKFDGDLTVFANVNQQGFWEGAMADVTVNGKSVNLAGRTSILDTGTTLIVAPQADAEAVHAAIPGSKTDGQGGFSVPCTTTAQVALSFGGKSFTIDPRDLAFQPLTNDLQGDCLSGISSGQIGGAKEWLVGDVFLKAVYFATDVDANQIGLAQRQPAGNGGAAVAGN